MIVIDVCVFASIILQALTDSNYSSKISNFCTKFSMSNSTTPNDSNSTSSSIGHASNISENHKHSTSFNKFSSNSGRATNVMENCVNTSGNNITKIDGTNAIDAAPPIKTGSASKSESGLNAFNTLTQRFTNFNFVNDKKQSSSSQNSHKKSFTFSKSTGNHTSFLHNSSNNSSNSGNSSSSRVSAFTVFCFYSFHFQAEIFSRVIFSIDFHRTTIKMAVT